MVSIPNRGSGAFGSNTREDVKKVPEIVRAYDYIENGKHIEAVDVCRVCMKSFIAYSKRVQFYAEEGK